VSPVKAFFGPQDPLLRRGTVLVLRAYIIQRQGGHIQHGWIFFKRKALNNELQFIVYSHSTTIHETRLREAAHRFQLFAE
jgi:hypothetical protein